MFRLDFLDDGDCFVGTAVRHYKDLEPCEAGFRNALTANKVSRITAASLH